MPSVKKDNGAQKAQEHVALFSLTAYPTLTQAWGFLHFYFKSLDSFNIQVVAKSGHV